LILPVVICLSQRLSHACLSMNSCFVRWNCEWLIKSAIVYLIVCAVCVLKTHTRIATWITVVILELIHAFKRPTLGRQLPVEKARIY